MTRLGDLSRALNRVAGGKPGQSLCGRVAEKYGHDCAFCRFIGFVTRDADHCWQERLKDIRRG